MAREYKPDWLGKVPTPAYVVEENRLVHNLEILAGLQERTGCHVLLAQKCFSMYHFYPLISRYLSGATASGLYEARLAYQELPGENHIFSPAYQESDFPEIAEICDHVVFNSIKQLKKFAPLLKEKGKSYGLRINPEHSTQSEAFAMYDPCSPESRLGVKLADFERELTAAGYQEFMYGIDGLHFHTLCEQGSEPLAETLEAVEKGFGKYFKYLKWLNFGGGHHITKTEYNIPLLEKCIRHVRETYGLEVYLEPGEAVALDAGYLASSVLDVGPVADGIYQNVILDTSAACHMPDVLEVPYRPPVEGGGQPDEKKYTYRLGGPTCLSGDNIGVYSFDYQLQEGDRILFGDMAIYTMVKNNTFNGMPLPSIVAIKADGSMEIVRSFGYEDFKMRL